MEGTKACSTCGEVKSLLEFSRDANKKSGLRASCRACTAKKCRSYRQSCIERDLVEWKLRELVLASKKRAKRAGIDHNLDLDYLFSILPDYCPYLGIKFHWEAKTNCGNRGGHPRSPSIDRIDSSKGYIKGNVAIVSHRANVIKHNATEQELFRIGRAVSLLKAEIAFPE